MSKATENLEAAQKRAMATRPKVGGFPYLAEVLRRLEEELLANARSFGEQAALLVAHKETLGLALDIARDRANEPASRNAKNAHLAGRLRVARLFVFLTQRHQRDETPAAFRHVDHLRARNATCVESNGVTSRGNANAHDRDARRQCFPTARVGRVERGERALHAE